MYIKNVKFKMYIKMYIKNVKFKMYIKIIKLKTNKKHKNLKMHCWIILRIIQQKPIYNFILFGSQLIFCINRKSIYEKRSFYRDVRKYFLT